MKFALLAMDLDGTALLNDRRSFSPRLLSALEKAHQKGVAIVPTTGRQYNMLPPPVRSGAEWQELCVLCNGSEIRRIRDGEILDAHYMERPHVLALLELAEALELPVEISGGGKVYLTQKSWDIQRQAGELLEFRLNFILPVQGCVVSDLRGFYAGLTDPVDKVLIPYVPEQVRAETLAALEKMPVSAVWSGPHSMEITSAEGTKAKGMLRVCRMLGIDPACTLAIGDSGNDIPMLRAAGLGVAMGNAPDEVRAAAHAVTAANEEDGAALAIEKYLL